jgi:DNA-directed RNA polymerase specialized sigma24 family protein
VLEQHAIHFQPRTGLWLWRPATRPKRNEDLRWKVFVLNTGFPYMRSYGGAEPLLNKPRILPRSFFLRVLSGSFFERANPGKGRFRSFLLGAVKNFLADERDREKTQKRGGGLASLPFDFETGESNYLREPRHEETPERIFQRKWARALLDRVVNKLRDEFLKEDKLEQFEKLKAYMVGSGDLKYVELARQLDVSEAALKSAIHRLRQRYRNLLRAEVAATVADSEEINEELRFLLRAVSVQPAEVR